MDPANRTARHPFGTGRLITAAARADAAKPGAPAKAKKETGTTAGLIVSTRVRFAFTAAPGTTDNARIRDITRALPPFYADRLFTAREQGATERQLQQIAAEGLAQMYFRATTPAPTACAFTTSGHPVHRACRPTADHSSTRSWLRPVSRGHRKTSAAPNVSGESKRCGNATRR
ncbi:telomere-protecting terminal protein Tpg [Streptomyces puniciscabiei]